MIVANPGATKDLPDDAGGIERWIKAMGGKKADARQRAELRKRGLIGMPSE